MGAHPATSPLDTRAVAHLLHMCILKPVKLRILFGMQVHLSCFTHALLMGWANWDCAPPPSLSLPPSLPPSLPRLHVLSSFYSNYASQPFSPPQISTCTFCDTCRGICTSVHSLCMPLSPLPLPACWTRFFSLRFVQKLWRHLSYWSLLLWWYVVFRWKSLLKFFKLLMVG